MWDMPWWQDSDKKISRISVPERSGAVECRRGSAVFTRGFARTVKGRLRKRIELFRLEAGNFHQRLQQSVFETSVSKKGDIL